jgi:hypothetical protein
MNVPVVPGYEKCQHCLEKLLRDAAGNLRTVKDGAPEYGGFFCPGMPAVRHVTLPKVDARA